MCPLTSCGYEFMSGKGFYEHWIRCHAERPLHWPVVSGADNLIDDHSDEENGDTSPLTTVPKASEEQHANEEGERIN